MRVRRGLLFLLIAVVVLAFAPSASANKPVREINPSQGDVVIRGQCAFPVLAHIEGQEIITTFTDSAGNPVKQIGIFPGNTLTLTNLDTGESLTVVSTGPFHLRVESDGSGSVMITGHGPFLSNPITGEPGIWYLSGRARATLDAGGNVTSAKLSGQLVDLCAELAP
jgi:hypothetical protein